MKRIGSFKAVMAAAAFSGTLMCASWLSAAEPATTPGLVGKSDTTAVVDVALREGGILIGLVLDEQGMPVKGAPVSLSQQGRETARAATNDSGYFQVDNLRGGTYRIVAGPGHGLYRLWIPGTAPPIAESGALVYPADVVMRGQEGVQGPIARYMSNPWVVGGIVSGAVAIPVALHNYRIDKDPASP